MEEQKKKMEEKVERPPPYAPTYHDIKKQMPVVRGTLEVDGNLSFVETDEEDDEEHRQMREREEKYARQEDNGQGAHYENNEQEKTNGPTPMKKRLTGNTRRQQQQQQKQRDEEQGDLLMDCSYVNQKRQEEEQRGGGKNNLLLDNPYYYMAEAIQELNRAGGNAASEPMARDQEENDSVDSLDHELNRLQETMERLSLEKQQRHLTKRARNLRRNLEEDRDEYYQRRRARSASPLGRHRKSSPHEEYKRVSGTLRLEKIPPEDPIWGKGEERNLVPPEDSMPSLTLYPPFQPEEEWGDQNPFQAKGRYSSGGHNSMLHPEAAYDLVTPEHQASVMAPAQAPVMAAAPALAPTPVSQSTPAPAGEAENAEEDADQEAHEGEGSGDPGEGSSNVVAEPSSREAEQPETRDEMRGQHEDPQASETEREGPDTGPTADVPTEPAATDPEPSGDQSPEAGPSTNGQPQPSGFLTELQGIDLPAADSDSPDIDLQDLSHTGDFPTLSFRDLEEIIGSAPTQDD
ncbi:hypothetical protein DPX16_2363 [Anabarilius grahami]|uniref:Uncharacterized protein n=1 Tax=Anabarilius grahami TaxID=495550 RepID=A0A3N0XTK9_ANAGA|nr:hypothetical protein DPX16_2363 [Anabarilius grahami]